MSIEILKESKITSETISLAISATFTAEPIEQILTFWMNELGYASSIQFAPYNQLFQQLLEPTSLLQRNNANQSSLSINVLLLRLEDWIGSGKIAIGESYAPLEATISDFVDTFATATSHGATPTIVCVAPATLAGLAITNFAEIHRSIEQKLARDLAIIPTVHLLLSADILGTELQPAYYDADSPFFVNTKLQPWESEMSCNLANYLRSNPNILLENVAYSLQFGRRTFNHSRVLVGQTPQDAVEQLDALNSQQVFTKRQLRRDLPTVFMFPGQDVNMGRDLYETEPLYRREIDRCAELPRPHMDVDLRTTLYPDMMQLDEAQLEETRTRINQTAIAQPAIFATSYALAKLWMSCGVEPASMVGHSIGEFVAATLAGIFSLEDALELVVLRGRMMQEMLPGSMMAVRLTEEALQLYIAHSDNPEVEIGAINGPSMCVLSGPTEQLEAIQLRLEADSVVCRPLHTSHAFHSAMMEPAVEPFAAKVRTLALNPPQRPIVSTVSTTC